MLIWNVGVQIPNPIPPNLSFPWDTGSHVYNVTWDHTSVPVKSCDPVKTVGRKNHPIWPDGMILLSNGLKRVHECDRRQTGHITVTPVAIGRIVITMIPNNGQLSRYRKHPDGNGKNPFRTPDFHLTPPLQLQGTGVNISTNFCQRLDFLLNIFVADNIWVCPCWFLRNNNRGVCAEK